MNAKAALRLTVAIVCTALVFHVLVLCKIVPYQMAWGGRITHDSDMVVFETISLAINGFLLFLLARRGRWLRAPFSDRLVKILLWMYVGIFTLNTVGNLFAKTAIERWLSVLTLLLAVLIGWLLRTPDLGTKE